ncbi:MAG: ComEC family competence protein [Candidatus Taylorbacteria bacterium]|nr:ComEC family competence protein [Candidatus Taylorbacteria bacterium]
MHTHSRKLLFVFLIAVCIVGARMYSVPNTDVNLSKKVGSLQTLCGVIIDEPNVKVSGTKFVLRVSDTCLEETKTGSLVEVHTRSLDPRISFGAFVKISGRLVLPENIVSDDGRVFDYVHYLQKDGIFTQIKNAKIEDIKKTESFSLKSELYQLKRKYMERVEEMLPVPHSLLANGLVISGKGSMSKELQEEFQRVGLIHIVVLSGSNVSIIGEVIIKIFSFLPKLLGAFFGGLGVVLFSMMVGGSATVVRSTIMSLIGIFARLTGKKNSALISLLTAGMLMLFHNPLLLFHDPSFQLSFLASLGLILYGSRIDPVLLKKYIKVKMMFGKKKVDELGGFEKGVLEIVSSSLSTQVGTLPFIVQMSGLVSVVALPVNILLLPLIPYTMLFVCITGVTSFISTTLASVPAFVSWILLDIILETVHVFSRLNFSVVEFGVVSDRFVIAMYIFLIIEYLWYLRKRKQVSH